MEHNVNYDRDTGAEVSDEESLDEKVVMVGGVYPRGIPGAVETWCQQCDGPAWLSPIAQELLKRRRAPTAIICDACAREGPPR